MMKSITMATRCLKRMGIEYATFTSRSEWLDNRRRFICASDAAAVLGLSPWTSERELFRAKMGDTPPKYDNADMRRGRDSESHIRELYRIESGCGVFDGTGILVRSSKYPWMAATLDAWTVEDRKIVPIEIKSVRGKRWDELPDHYYLQVLHQMIVVNANEGRLIARFCRFEDNETSIENVYHVYRDDDTEAKMRKLISAEQNFFGHMLAGRMPSMSLPKL